MQNTVGALFTVKLDEKSEFVEKWYICGPFEKSGTRVVEDRWADPSLARPSFAQALAEETFDTKDGPRGWVLTPIENTEMLSTDPVTGRIHPLKVTIIDFLKAYPDHSTDSSAYALAFVESPSNVSRDLLVGSDDGIAIWLNGEKIHECQATRPIVPDEDLVIAKFKSGLNVLLIKVTNSTGYWGFMLRFFPADGTVPPLRLP